MAMPLSQELAKTFEEIDADYNGYITRKELQDYARRTGQPESMVDDWFKWFDYSNAGKITYTDLCETLAIAMTKQYTQKVEQKREMEKQVIVNSSRDSNMNYEAPKPRPDLMEGVKVLHTGHSEPGLLESIVEELKAVNLDNFEKESKLARHLKETLEKKWGHYWQVIVSPSTFGCAVGHEENYFVHFQYGSNLYIIYRTTE